MISAHDDVELVVEAMRAGAVDYLIKPLALDKLRATIRQAVAMGRRPASGITEGLIGSSPQMQRIREEVALYAPANSPVVVSGESGVGKEVVARSLHSSSPRAGQPWVAINCGAIAPTIVETELFGSERGAYTDAVSRPGCFERADNGTLFLDEIGEMGTDLQVKLLRVLEAQEVTRIGGTRTQPVDVRTIAATNTALSNLMETGRFRDDLYYRLGVLLIHVPPLRERLQDVVELAYHFLPEKLRLTRQATARLEQHHWPGNVRELRNVMERAVLLAGVQPGNRRTVDANAIRFQ
jgi:DNA-binding NtrC family response regulator